MLLSQSPFTPAIAIGTAMIVYGLKCFPLSVSEVVDWSIGFASPAPLLCGLEFGWVVLNPRPNPGGNNVFVADVCPSRPPAILLAVLVGAFPFYFLRPLRVSLFKVLLGYFQCVSVILSVPRKNDAPLISIIASPCRRLSGRYLSVFRIISIRLYLYALLAMDNMTIRASFVAMEIINRLKDFAFGTCFGGNKCHLLIL